MQRALNLVGLCARAGRLKSGLDACEQAVKHQGAKLCLVDEGASAASRKIMEDACRFAGAQMLIFPKDALGQAIGKPGRVAVAIMDEGFARKIIDLMTSNGHI